MYIAVCIDCAICIILACDVYLPDLQVFKTWDFGSMARPEQAKKLTQAKLAAWEALRSVPSHVTKRGCGTVDFWKETRMDSVAAATTMS
jgi:hypothetical protein